MTLPPDAVGDNGQRYEIHCLDEDDDDICIGWSDSPDSFKEAVRLHPGWHSRYVIDREQGYERLASD